MVPSSTATSTGEEGWACWGRTPMLLFHNVYILDTKHWEGFISSVRIHLPLHWYRCELQSKTLILLQPFIPGDLPAMTARSKKLGLSKVGIFYPVALIFFCDSIGCCWGTFAGACCSFHCWGVRAFRMESAWISFISSLRAAFTSRCRSRSLFPSKAAETTWMSKLAPHLQNSKI